MWENLKTNIVEMKIDNEKVHALSRYKKYNNKTIQTVSDHNILFAKYDMTYSTENKVVDERKQIYNFKDDNGKLKFKMETSKGRRFTSCFQSNDSLKNANKFHKVLKKSVFHCFPKICLKQSQSQSSTTKIQEEMKLKKQLLLFLKTNQCKLAKIIATIRIEKCNDILAQCSADENVNKIKNHVTEVEGDKGKLSQLKLWKLKSKLFDTPNSQPTAKKDSHGNLVLHHLQSKVCT